MLTSEVYGGDDFFDVAVHEQDRHAVFYQNLRDERSGVQDEKFVLGIRRAVVGIQKRAERVRPRG